MNVNSTKISKKSKSNVCQILGANQEGSWENNSLETQEEELKFALGNELLEE